jgi:surface polysaccharide O-acyltransferase-like enzyme
MLIDMRDAKLREIQALRGIAIISVVLIHTVSAFVFMPAINAVSASALVIDVFSHFAVPLFIFISGFVLALKSYSLETFYLRRFKSVVPAYLIFSVLYAVYYQKDIINSILMANAETHLPFLKIIMTLYLLYPFIIKLYDFKEGKLNPLMLILTSLVLVISPIPTFSTHLSFLNVLPYFLVGIYVSRNYDTIHTRIELLNPMIVLILILPLWAIEAQCWFSRYYSSYRILPIINTNLLPIILYILIFIFIYKAAIKLPIMSLVGNYAFGIYLVHQFFMNEIRRILYSIGLYYVYPPYYIILFITAFTLSFMAAIIWSKASCIFKNQFDSQRISKREGSS